MGERIPDVSEPEIWRQEKAENSKFVEITDGGLLRVEMQYPRLGMEYAEKGCFVRQEVYDLLLKAQDSLPQKIGIQLLDAWRPYRLQEELYRKYSKNIIWEFHLEGLSEKARNKVIEKYVCPPIKERFRGPVHCTGGAVDVTLYDMESGQELFMGTEFDEMKEPAHTSYFEQSGSREARDNRRILYYAMTDAGFTNLPSEWWHYDYGDRFWAYYTRQPIKYAEIYERGGIILADISKEKAKGAD